MTNLSKGNTQEWGSALKGINNNLSNFLLKQTREKSQYRIDTLGLPTNTWKITTLDEFLKEVDNLPETYNTKQYFVSLTSQTNDKKFTLVGNKKMILKDIAELPEDKYTATVKSFYEDIYGGNIILGDDYMYIEFKPGGQKTISTGTCNADDIMTIKKVPLKKSFEYSFDDEQLRELMYSKVIPHLKHHREGTKIIFDYPGYYEFALEWNEEKQEAETMFFDYNPDIKDLL